jgi:hypothetical protein
MRQYDLNRCKYCGGNTAASQWTLRPRNSYNYINGFGWVVTLIVSNDNSQFFSSQFRFAKCITWNNARTAINIT